LLAGRLRPANIDASAGATEEVARIIGRIRRHWPRTRILPRADSGFAREAVMAWCEANRIDYLFGLARNDLVPHSALEPIACAANGLTVISMAALGLGTDIRALARAGTSVTATVALSLLVLAATAAVSDPIAPYRLRTIDTASHEA
jgi:hypothetical protein